MWPWVCGAALLAGVMLLAYQDAMAAMRAMEG
jgi:hypothetical protein